MVSNSKALWYILPPLVVCKNIIILWVTSSRSVETCILHLRNIIAIYVFLEVLCLLVVLIVRRTPNASMVFFMYACNFFVSLGTCTIGRDSIMEFIPSLVFLV